MNYSDGSRKDFLDVFLYDGHLLLMNDMSMAKVPGCGRFIDVRREIFSVRGEKMEENIL